MKSLINKLLFFLYITWVWFSTLIYLEKTKDNNDISVWLPIYDASTWEIPTWINDPNSKDDNFTQIEVFSWDFSITTLEVDKYPKVKINKPIKWWKIIFDIEVVDSVKDYWYFTSPKYFFALRFFIWDFKNGWYFNVFRSEFGWVENSKKSWLDWAIPGVMLKEWFTWEIPIDKEVIIAKNKDEYWYTYINTLDIINSYVWKEINIWWFLSSIKEYPEGGWQITKIKRIYIDYEWEKDSIVNIR